MYYRGAAAAIVVFDVTNKDSFSGAKTWVKELQRRGDANCVIALAGNKADLIEQRKVSKEVAEAYAAENGILFMETSAKTGTFEKCVYQVLRKSIFHCCVTYTRLVISMKIYIFICSFSSLNVFFFKTKPKQCILTFSLKLFYLSLHLLTVCFVYL